MHRNYERFSFFDKEGGVLMSLHAFPFKKECCPIKACPIFPPPTRCMTVCFVFSRGLPTEPVVRLDALLQDLRPGGHPAEDEDGQGAPQEQGRPLWAQSGTKVLLDPAALPTVLTLGERHRE